MDEATLYNLQAMAAGAGRDAQNSAYEYARQLMIAHLYREHKMDISEIAKFFNRDPLDVMRQLYPDQDFSEKTPAKKRKRK